MKNKSPQARFANKLVVLIGSGASAGLGYPTTDELTAQAALERLSNKLLSDELIDFASNIDLYLRTIRGNVSIELAIDRTNFYIKALEAMAIDQNFIAYLIEQTIERSKAGAMLEAARTVRELFYESLYHIYSIHEISREHRQAAQNLAELYIYLANSNGENREPRCLDIFTTNYDLALEAIFKNNPTSVNLIDKYFPLQHGILSSSPKSTDSSAVNVAIHRLHGCVEWYLPENGKPLRWKKQKGIRPWSNMAVKVGPDGSEIDREPFKSTYAEFRRKLGEAGTICVVLGVGFHDPYLAHCIYEALASKSGCEALIVMDKYLNEGEIYKLLTKFPGVDRNLLQSKYIKVLNHAVELDNSIDLLEEAFREFRIWQVPSKNRIPHSIR